MRICHVASGDLWAGAEVQVCTLVEYLSRQPGIAVSAVVMNERELAARLRGLGVDLTVLDETRLGALATLRGMAAAMRRLRPDVVHTHRYKENVLGGLAALAAGRPALVQTVHGLTERYRGWRRIKSVLHSSLDGMVSRLLGVTVVAVSQDMAARLGARGRRSVRFVPNAIQLPDLERVARADLPGVEPRATVIGTAGRLVPVKAFDVLLAAAPEVARATPDVRFVLLGDGPLMRTLRAQAAALGLDGRVIFAGHVPDVRPYLRAMDVFVLPSHAEGLPMALLEAMAAGLPVVASAVGGVPEVVREGVEGLLVPPGAPAPLAAALSRLAADGPLRAAMGTRGRARVAEAFSIEATGPRYVALYSELSARARAAA
jgi:L-malate glycosyltransferase